MAPYNRQRGCHKRQKSGHVTECGLTQRQTHWPIAGRNMTLTLKYNMWMICAAGEMAFYWAHQFLFCISNWCVLSWFDFYCISCLRYATKSDVITTMKLAVRWANISIRESNYRNFTWKIYLRILWVWHSNNKHFAALHVQSPHTLVMTSNIKVPYLETLKEVAENCCTNLKLTEIPIRNCYA
jgi:hypothetical protein